MPVSRVTNHRGTASETDLQLDDHLRRSDRGPRADSGTFKLYAGASLSYPALIVCRANS